MLTFGDRLRQERESRKKPIEEIAGSTQIGRRYLEALERNEFDSLPGNAIGKLYIRAYAEVLGFDPQPLIDAYDEERQNRARPDAEPDPAPAVRTKHRRRAWLDEEDRPEEPVDAEPSAPDPTPDPTLDAMAPASVPPSGARTGGRKAIVAAVAVGIAGLWVTLFVLGRGEDPGGRQVASPPIPSSAAAATVEPLPPLPEVSAPQANPAPADPVVAELDVELDPEPAVARDADAEPASPAPAAGRLSVSESEVGREVVDLRIVTPTRSFDEGTAACFLTRVLGGTRGESIRHVWIHEGKTIQSIRLTLGGSNWRTYSRKTLWGQGRWTVEARDADGRVLARESFESVRRRRRR